MFAAICTPKFYKDIEQVVTSLGENILFKDIGKEIDISEDFEKVSRLSIKHFIIDITLVTDDKLFINTVRRYRITNDKAQIIIISPGCIPGNLLLHNLVSMGIYDIICPTENVTIAPLLLDVINNPSPYKKAVKWIIDNPPADNTNNKNVKEKVKEVVVEKTVYKTKTIRQQVIAFFTTDNNTMKDLVISNLSVLLAQKSEQSVLIIDMNVPTPSLDHHFGVPKEVYVQDIYNENKVLTGLSACYSAIQKNIFSTDSLKLFVKEIKGFKNLDLLTGLYDIDITSKMGEDDYIKIIDTAAQIYDTIIISVNPFLSCTATLTSIFRANKVLVTCDATYTNARNTLSIVRDELINYQKIPRDKFKFIITNVNSLNLDKDTMKKIFEGFQIIGFIPENKYYLKSLNNKKPLLLSSHGKKDIISYLSIIGNLGYIPKLTVFDKVFKRNKLIKAYSDNEGEK